MSFNIRNKINFTDSFQFLSSSLVSLVKALGKNNFKYFNNILDTVKQKMILLP